ncbi:bifunctional folylpolyglutamate synthase/dihydrofolate synthase [Sporosarcina sp. Marseille-Q4063]|uniref:bifunctional folylpolyglutamate synthase/dihydrofolate synthase n=1 Tax=Sporosarcina sp. Marseille-Q4063 TaxID=2810514 RepID=UPI001BAED4E6|nr:folylpolyglutamate synthase/dihydrofolate synthase family protein [Sporosarcina sp. Marseille-Q4063]QUW22509.1 bifunctional folylpolyglutamate synthase/dihydrofolate synthase [Sporosarcina sp. Marseille-Q4063]
MIPKMKEYKERWGINSDDAIKPGLEAIQKALQVIGNPEKTLKIIHVTGTNGKGSTIAFMESILKENGYSTGVFSSPAIFDIHDQIRLNGTPISEEELNQTFKEMTELSGMLTDFELLTVAAFISFKRSQPDYVLVETGMGGLLDSTNVVIPLVSVITSIALDHTTFLGTTLNEVAVHKAGIIKKGIPVITGPLQTEPLQVVSQVAGEKGSLLRIYGIDFSMENEEQFKGQQNFKLCERKMKGEHQGINSAIAIQALLMAGISLSEDKVGSGIAKTELAHRFQEIAPRIFLDGAHNPAAARALTNTIKTEFPNEKVDFVIGMLKGKDIKGTLDELIPVAESFTFITFPHKEAASGNELMEKCNFKKKKVLVALGGTIELVEKTNTKSIVTGSLYLLASLKYR